MGVGSGGGSISSKNKARRIGMAEPEGYGSLPVLRLWGRVRLAVRLILKYTSKAFKQYLSPTIKLN